MEHDRNASVATAAPDRPDRDAKTRGRLLGALPVIASVLRRRPEID